MRPMPKLETHELPVADLVPYTNNAKKHPAKQVDEIAASIAEFGNCDPIGVWHNEQGQPEIVEGHGRVMALQKLGIETAPVIFLDHLTDEQRRAYTHVHNQTTLSSDFDYDALVADMDNLNMDWESFGFEEYLYDPEEAACVEDEGVPETVECRCKPGEVWMLGAHRVKCGSATDSDDLKNLVRGGRWLNCCSLTRHTALATSARPKTRSPSRTTARRTPSCLRSSLMRSRTQRPSWTMARRSTCSTPIRKATCSGMRSIRSASLCASALCGLRTASSSVGRTTSGGTSLACTGGRTAHRTSGTPTVSKRPCSSSTDRQPTGSIRR